VKNPEGRLEAEKHLNVPFKIERAVGLTGSDVAVGIGLLLRIATACGKMVLLLLRRSLKFGGGWDV
jgi:hypothetical protein